MKICVLGAGVIGVSTAFALSRLGHDVEVIERASRVASGASHANGAQLSWSHTAPLASPDIVTKLPAFVLGLDPAMRVQMSLRPDFMAWGLSFLRHCSSVSFANGYENRNQLAEESRNALSGFERELKTGPMIRTGQGKIVLAQSRKQQRTMQASDKYRSAKECIDIEPALNSWTGSNMGGLYAPDDCALNPVQFCEHLQRASEDQFGATFRFGESVRSIQTRDGCVETIVTDICQTACDAVVVCLGNQVNPLIKPLGLSVPICSVRGYSVTLPARQTAPKVSLTDLTHKIVFANLGDRVRIAGFADVNASQARMSRRIETLMDIAKSQWPDIADYDAEPSAWSGERPMTPSGIPIIGGTTIGGLFLNAGHGSLGFTFAAGSAMRIAKQVGGLQ